MDERSVTREQLPELELRELRELDVERDQGDDRAPLVAAASAVVRRGDFVYVIGDDELDLAVFAVSDPSPGRMRRALPGEVPDSLDERQKRKPDLEALTMLPPFAEAPFGGLFGLGSGSGPGRDRGFFWRFAADGSLEGEPGIVDLHPVYERLRADLGELNIEGAAVLGQRLWLFHRGNASGGRNAVAELELEQIMGSVAGDLEIDISELSALRFYELGELDGVPLCFSDATPLGESLIAFTASAEGDDSIRGSVVGTIAGDGEVHRLRTIDRRWKVEGIHATIEAGVLDLLFVCDQDSDDEPSPLLSAMMPAAKGLE